jgi:hypothetical protein
MKRHTALARMALLAALWPLMDAVVRACPICFQIEDGHVSAGVRAAVVVLIGVTSTVVGGCAVFFGRLLRDEPRTEEPRNLGAPELRTRQ